MKRLLRTFFLCGIFPGALIGQSADFGRRQPIPPPQVGVPATPIASLASPAPTAGISLQGRMGISSNVEIIEGAASTLSPATLVYENTTIWSSPETTAVIETSREETRGPDLGPSFFVDAGSQPQSTISLGEVAALYKAMRRSKSIRVYTNADVEELLRRPLRFKGSAIQEQKPPF